MAARESSKTTSLGPAIPDPAPELFTQRKRAETGRYRLLVDRQLKRSFPTSEAAQIAGQAIKHAHPVVQVVMYDAIDGINTAIEIAKT